MQIFITKRDGSRESFDADKINRSIERACEGLPNAEALTMQIATETRLTLYDGITTEEMDRATIEAAVQNIKDDPVFNRAATRLLLKTIYKKALGDYTTHQELKRLYRERFAAYIDRGIALGFLDARLKEKFDLNRLAEAINPERDELFTYTGLDTLMKRYSIQEKGNVPLEAPQYLFMRVAMGIALTENEADDWAIRFYEKMSKHEYIAGGSTNVNAGTINPRLSNCFLIDMQDDMDHIAKSVHDVLLISKATGGIGMTVTRLRSEGSPLGNSNTVSSGPIPFIKIIDTAIRAVIRAGKKVGALCFYMENWHYDFDSFLDLKQNAGDDYLRARTANTAVYLSDEFMRRVVEDEDWYLFDPKETPDLIELYGAEFSRRYNEYVQKAERGEMHLFRKTSAREQYRRIIVSLQTTSHPWITWKDSTNLRALNDNTGVINGSNLCTEITLPHNRDNTAVCNLLSINIARHIRGGALEWQKLEQSVRLGVRHLDNLVDINKLPVPEAVKSDRENRAVGMGVMGVSDALEQLNLPYDSEGAYQFVDRIFEFISYMAIDESARLAKERGSYPNFAGSGWSRGLVPIDTFARLENERGRVVTVNQESAHRGLDWDALRSKVKQGMRNATVLAVAPNANIGLVAGTSPGIDPRFTQMFSRNKYSGKYLEINSNLVSTLQSRGLWEQVKDKILESQGDISEIDEIPDDIKAVYKTSFTISPYAFIEIAARAQKWVDQALSRNMYLAIRDADEIMNVYLSAWEKGLKTTYYLHMKPRHRAEQSTVKVNKATAIGKKGFGTLREEAVLVTELDNGAVRAVYEEVEVREIVDELARPPQNMPTGAGGFASIATFVEKVAPEMQLPLGTQTSTPQTVGAKGFGGAVARSGFASAAAPTSTGVTQSAGGAAAPIATPSASLSPLQLARQQKAAQKAAMAKAHAMGLHDSELVDPMEKNVCDSCQ